MQKNKEGKKAKKKDAPAVGELFPPSSGECTNTQV